jgi:hypothetical protein
MCSALITTAVVNSQMATAFGDQQESSCDTFFHRLVFPLAKLLSTQQRNAIFSIVVNHTNCFMLLHCSTSIYMKIPALLREDENCYQQLKENMKRQIRFVTRKSMRWRTSTINDERG